MRFMPGFLPWGARLSLLKMIQRIGADANLNFALDAGDINSWPGSGQEWIDANGSGNNFYRGTNNTTETGEPSFNGTAGRLSESDYWGLPSLTAASFFTEVGTQSYFNNWHKDNAAFSILGVAYKPAGSGGTLFATAPLVSPGLILTVSSVNGRLTLQVSGGFTHTTTAALTDNSLNFFAATVNEATGANGCTIQINGTQEFFSSTYSSPSGSDRAQLAQIGVMGGTSGRNLCIAGASRRWTNTELTDIRTRLKRRFKSLP